jgi:hypothetical protein
MLLIFRNVPVRLWTVRVHLVSSAATDRLGWILDGLNGDPGGGVSSTSARYR